MKKSLILLSLILLIGADCNNQSDIVDQQQKQIEELSKKVEILSQLSTSSESTSGDIDDSKLKSTSPTIIERVVTVKQDNSATINALEEKIKKLEEENKEEKLTIIGGSNQINHNSFIKNVVQVVCLNGSGSGTIINPGTILTNYHVVEGNSECYVKFTKDPSKPPTEKVLGPVFSIDPIRDRAVIKVSADLANASIPICDAQNTELSDDLVIMGYPSAGGSTLTVTNGIISGFQGHYIKTSAKINPGNSGGAAIHASGCYLGIPTAVNVSGIEAIGLIVDERVGGSIADNQSSLLETGNQEPQNSGQEGVKNYLENKNKYDFFVKESKYVIDTFNNLYSNKVIAAANYINKREYHKSNPLLQSLHQDFEDLTRNHLDPIEPFEGFESMQRFKDDFRAMVNYTKGVMVSNIERMSSALANSRWDEYDTFFDKVAKTDDPKVTSMFSSVQSVRSQVIEDGTFHFYR